MNKWWVRGWIVILFSAVTYELCAATLEAFGYTAFPTLSRLIVSVIPSSHCL